MQTSSQPQTRLEHVTAWALRRKLVRTGLLYSHKNSQVLADAITYRTLFAVFAAIVLGFGVAGLVFAGRPEIWESIMAAVDRAIPGIGAAVNLNTFTAPTGWSITSVVAIGGLVAAALGAVAVFGLALREIDGTAEQDRNVVWEVVRRLVIAASVGGLFVLSALITHLSSLGLRWLSDTIGFPSARFVDSVGSDLAALGVVFLLDIALIALLFRSLSGLRVPARLFWPGVILGAIGLVVLQQLSSLFVAGVGRRFPVATAVLSLLMLLLWLNFSARVVLFAWAYIITGMHDEHATGSAPTTLDDYKAVQLARETAAIDAYLATGKATGLRTHPPA